MSRLLKTCITTATASAAETATATATATVSHRQPSTICRAWTCTSVLTIALNVYVILKVFCIANKQPKLINYSLNYKRSSVCLIIYASSKKKKKFAWYLDLATRCAISLHTAFQNIVLTSSLCTQQPYRTVK